MKRLPVILAGVFLAITLSRVAMFTGETMSAGLLMGWLFSIGLGVAVYASSYWTRNQTTRKAAVVAMCFFIGVDAFFNFAHVWMTAQHTSGLATTGAVLYGLFPTAAVALLAWLQTSINKQPPAKNSANVSASVEKWIASKFAISAKDENMAISEAVTSATDAPITRRGTYLEFIEAQSKRNGKGPMSAAEIMAQFGVPKRTAYNWMAKEQAQQVSAVEAKNGNGRH